MTPNNRISLEETNIFRLNRLSRKTFAKGLITSAGGGSAAESLPFHQQGKWRGSDYPESG
jgi:hypothetical protein